MGLFKSLTVLLLDFLEFLFLTNAIQLKVFHIGDFVHRNIDKYRAELIVAFMATYFYSFDFNT